MILRFLSDNVLSLLLGNISSLERLFQPDRDLLWKSRFRYYYYPDKGAAIMVIVLSLLWSGLGYLFIINNPSFLTIFFFTAGIIGLVALPHYFDQLYLYHDRIEIRFFLNTYKTIFFEEVTYALRDKVSQSAVHILYIEEPWGYAYSQNGIEGVWFLPARFFQKKQLKLKPEKIHKNVFLPFETIKSTLPEVPLKHARINLLNLQDPKTYALLSLLIVNPFTVFIFVTSAYGLRISPFWYLISTLLSTEVTKLLYAYSISSGNFFDDKAVKPN